MTSPKEVIENIVLDFNRYVDDFDTSLVDEEFIRLDVLEKLSKLYNATRNVVLCKDFIVYFLNYLIDLKYNEHLKIFYKKDNLTVNEIVDKITQKVNARHLDYHCFNDEINSIEYNPKLEKWDSIWLTDIPERVIINLLSNNNITTNRIIGMANISNYRKLKDYNDILDGFNYLRKHKDYEPIAYLLRRDFGRNVTKYEYANVKSNNEFNIGYTNDFKDRIDSIKHEAIHSKYYHTERFNLINMIYKLSPEGHENFYKTIYTSAIENNVRMKLYNNRRLILMNQVMKSRRSNKLLCRQIINSLEPKGFSVRKFK